MRVVVLVWLGGIAAGLLISGLLASARAEARLEVRVSAVTDGDSLRAGKLRLRLHGVDAPERKQLCSSADGRRYRCGQQAADWLKARLGPDPVLSCTVLDIDRYRRLVVRCLKDGTDINHALVRAGWAVAYTRYSDAYAEAEQQARAEGAGIWQGTFARPEAWRQQQRKKQS